MVALGSARRMSMKGRQGREVETGDRRGPHPMTEVSGKLGPEGRFQAQVFTRGDKPRFGDQRARGGQTIGQLARVGAIDQDRSLMVAHHEAIGRQIVQRSIQARDLRGGTVARAKHLVLFAA